MAFLPSYLLGAYAGGCGCLELHHDESSALEQRVVGDAGVAVVLVLPAVPAVRPRPRYAAVFKLFFNISHRRISQVA